jgi:hypothetical protein
MNQTEKEKINENIIHQYARAKNNRQNWETHWQECYDYALPQRGGFYSVAQPGTSRVKSLYDGTALDAVEQLAASLLGNLTPPWTPWFGFKPGPDLSESEARSLAPVLEDIAKKIQLHLDRSNFSVEMHQCFLDLVVGGTSTLFFEETAPGSSSAFKFSAVPLQEIYLEEGSKGFLDRTYRILLLTLAQIKNRYPAAVLPVKLMEDTTTDKQDKYKILECIVPEKGAYLYKAFMIEDQSPVLLSEGRFSQSPAISFRWMKSPGEIYGRSPVMKALPDIKTANKVVELILKNASIAVTGIWQADDDGVLNPANIDLVPGAIIPKAVGSQGLKPLDMPGRFDVSELVLKDLRSRIRHALLTDKLGPVVDGRMTATEILERSAEMGLLLGATYGRLQSELLTPLIERAFYILKRRGEIPDIELDGRYVSLDYRSPLARSQGQRSVQNVLTWLNTVAAMGAEASLSIDVDKTARYLGESLGVPNDLIKTQILPEPLKGEGGDVL